VEEASYTKSRTDEANVIIVMGQGQEEQRRIVVRTDPIAMADSPWNTYEVCRDARNSETLAAMNASGDESLKELQAQESFKLSPVQVDICRYGRDYFNGDIVKGRFLTYEKALKITKTQINYNGGKESITHEFENYP
jgi:hypothetical protein